MLSKSRVLCDLHCDEINAKCFDVCASEMIVCAWFVAKGVFVNGVDQCELGECVKMFKFVN